MSDYWVNRNKELERIKAQFSSDADYNRELARIYNRAQREIDKEIQSELMSFATREQVSMAEAQRRVDKMDVEAFKEKAKRYVEEKNFSPRANEELRSYNVRMRMSRLELLKHDIHLETVALADEENKLLTARLSEEARAEFERQAGILGEALPDNLDRIVRQIVVADFQGTDFSERIWRDQKQLRNALSNTLDDVLIRGQHPRKASTQLRELVSESFHGKRGNGGAKYVAERLAITESARIQSGIQKASYEEYGIRQYEYLAEPDACDICGAMDGEIFNVSAMQPGVNASPMHSNCRCSSSGVVDRQAFESAFEQSEPLDLESDEGKESKKKTTSEDKRSDNDIIKLGELESKYASKHVDKVKEMLSDSSEKIKQVWNDVADNFKVLDSKKKGAFFNRGNAAGEGRGVKLNIASVAKGNDYQKPYQVFFHEYGHHMDYELNKKYGNKLYDQAFSQVYKDGLLDKTIKEEGRKVINEYADKNYDRIATEKLPGVWNKRYNNLKGKYSGWEDIESKLNDRDFVGPERLMLDMVRNQVHDEWQTTMKDSLKPSQRSDISDMFEAVSVNSYPLGYGHGKAYHNKNGSAKEAFAEMYSATISNPESLEQIKKYFPKSYKVFEEIIGVVE